MALMDIDKTLQAAARRYEAGNALQAESLCREVLKIQPENAGALFLSGLICQESNEFEQAIKFYQKALQSDPALVSAYYNLGSIFQEKGQPDEAVTYYQKALELDTTLADVWNAMGIIFQEKGLLAEAIKHYKKAVELNPDLADAYYNLGKAFWEEGQCDGAMTYYQKALQLNPNSAETYNNLGFCLQAKGHPEKALVYFQRAIGLNPHFAEAYYNLALYYHDRNLPDEAVEYYRKAVENKPDFVNAHWNMACALLLAGKFEQGWKEYEWRWKLKDHRGRTFPSSALWDGSDISGRTVLLHAEQGFGDAIQFIRYAPLVAERGARVIVQCPEEVVSLFRTVKGVAQVFSERVQLPEFDLQCPLLSLPRVFGTTPGTIPVNIPYIAADALSVEEWKQRLQHDGSTLKAGLVWTGRSNVKRERDRSCSLELFSPLSRINGITFYSLQKGRGAEQVKTPPLTMHLVDYTEEIKDFADTAALIANLDLVISVDTAAAHLAGALGKPVWTLLPFVPDWRWMLKREDNPWYPTMRLFRQPAPGSWEAVIRNIERDLENLLLRSGDNEAEGRRHPA
jgi:tetratricopeptide (TPR) repeat protein